MPLIQKQNKNPVAFENNIRVSHLPYPSQDKNRLLLCQKLQKQTQDRRQEIIQAMAPKYEKVLNDLIQIDQIDLILSPNQLQYTNAKHDISRRVTEKLNEASE